MQASVAEAGGISVLARLWDFALGEPELLQDLLGLSGNLVADSTTALRTFFSQVLKLLHLLFSSPSLRNTYFMDMNTCA